MKRSSRLKRSKEHRDKVERPLRERELLKSLPARDPIGEVDSEIEFDIPIAAEETPEVQVRLHKVTSEHTMIKGIQDYRLQLLVHKDKFGVHSFSNGEVMELRDGLGLHHLILIAVHHLALHGVNGYILNAR
jgi:hypothetical protein